MDNGFTHLTDGILHVIRHTCDDPEVTLFYSALNICVQVQELLRRLDTSELFIPIGYLRRPIGLTEGDIVNFSHTITFSLILIISEKKSFEKL